MNNYDFNVLDDKEFEALVTDLMGAVFKCRVERFKAGKDGGVDGRWFSTPGQESIIQCKHWARTGFPKLLKSLAKCEAQKLSKLNPTRYILATSIELSRGNKADIASALSPYIRSEDDVYGREDLEDLIAQHPQVERRHYKLWLASTEILGHILNNDVYARSGFDVSSIRRKAPLFVKTADFERARNLLDALHTVILTGAPGIGKTTLAEQLVLNLIAEGYELISMQDVGDAEKAIAPDRKQVFYFDDFLGRNLLEGILLKQDAKIVHFIDRVRHDSLKRFVLTSRTTILNQGKYWSDLFVLKKTHKNEYKVEISSLSRLDRARILYSHVWHSDLPVETLNEIFVNKHYMEIAGHRNFNPRLVEFVTDSEFVGDIPAKDYWNHVVRTLENPQQLWEHYFNQIDGDCRDVVYLVALHGRSIREGDLRKAFYRLKTRERCHAGTMEKRATDAIKICAGAVLDRKLIDDKEAIFDLYNPSIGDYVIGKIGSGQALAEFLEALLTEGSLYHLDTLHSSQVIAEETYAECLREIARCDLGPASVEYLLELGKRLLGGRVYGPESERFMDEKFAGFDFARAECDDEVVLEVISRGLQRGYLRDADGLAERLCSRLVDAVLDNAQVEAISHIVEYVSAARRQEIAAEFRRLVKRYWIDGYLSEFINDADILADFYDIGEYDAAYQELFDSVRLSLHNTGLRFSADEIAEICQSIDLDEILERNISRATETAYEQERPSGAGHPKQLEDELIDDLFDRGGPRANI